MNEGNLGLQGDLVMEMGAMIMLQYAQLAAVLMMQTEEGEGLDEVSWEYVTVNLEEYRSMHSSCFKLHFRMSKPTFMVLVTVVQDHLITTHRWRRRRTDIIDIMMMVIWVLATPDCFRSIALRFGVRPSTLHFHYAYIIEALRELAPRFIKWPNAERRRQISNAFERASGFPGIIGCIDCTHVYITAPVQQPARYRNRHHTYSLNVQAVCDHELNITDLHVGEVGSMNDNRVFRRSPLYRQLLEDNNHTSIEVDQHILGDGAYTLTDFMMVPFANNGHLTANQLRFNKRLSRNRVRIENAFARAKGKWRRLRSFHAINPEYVVNHISACFMFHNFVLTEGEELLPEDELQFPIDDDEVQDNPERFELEPLVLDEDAPQNVHPMLNAAKRRGIEKRLFLQENVLPNVL